MKLSQAEIDQFNSNGYLVARGALHDRDLAPVIAEYETYIDRRAEELVDQGHIKQTYANEPFERRLTGICQEYGDIYGELDTVSYTHLTLPTKA